MDSEGKDISLLVCLSLFFFCILCAGSIYIIDKIYSNCCHDNLITAECKLDNNTSNNTNLVEVVALPV